MLNRYLMLKSVFHLSLLLWENSPSINLAWMERLGCCWWASVILFCTLIWPLFCLIWRIWAVEPDDEVLPFSLLIWVMFVVERLVWVAFGKRLRSWLELTTMTFGPLLVPLFPMLPFEIVRIPLIVVVDEIPFPLIGSTRGCGRPNCFGPFIWVVTWPFILVPFDGFKVVEMIEPLMGVQDALFNLFSICEFGLSWGIPATVATSFLTLFEIKITDMSI